MIEIILAFVVVLFGVWLVLTIIKIVLGPQIREYQHSRKRSVHHPVYQSMPTKTRPCVNTDCTGYGYMLWTSENGNTRLLMCMRHATERIDEDGGTIVRRYR